MTPDPAVELADALTQGPPTFYLDANVLVDLVSPRRPASNEFMAACLMRSWICRTSTFAVMEALDREQENVWARSEIRKGRSFDQVVRKRSERTLTLRVLKKTYERFEERLDERVERFQPEADVWEDAIRLAIETNSFAPDCIHVAAAISCSCDVLVTWDQPLRQTAASEIQVATPDEVLSTMNRLGL